MSVDVPGLLAQAEIVDKPTLTAWLGQLDDGYHNGTGLISDADYDRLLGVYTRRFGPYEVVGAAPKENKVDLPYPLYSLDKIAMKFDDPTNAEVTKGLERYMGKYGGPYLVEDKIDGLTGLYFGERLYTRGDGKVGMDISNFIDILRLPSNEGLPIRGEIVMHKTDFAIYRQLHPDSSNPRNTTSGIVNSKTVDITAARTLKYYAYQIINSEETPEQQIQRLRGMGFNTAYVAKTDRLSVAILENFVRQRKVEAAYDVDGAVIIQNEVVDYPTDRNPRHAIAFKLDTPNTVTRVIEVEWRAQKDRSLWPRVTYEPFQFEGSTLTHANGKNAKYIIENGIGPGAMIRVTRSQEIIPDILETVQRAEPQLPDFPEADYHWDTNKVQFVLNYDNEEVFAKKLEAFINRLDIKDVGPARIKAFVDQGKVTILELVTATVAEFATLDRVGMKTAQKMWDNIHNGIVNVPLSRLMAASGIFGKGFSEKRSEVLIQHYPNFLHLAVLPMEEIIPYIVAVEGFGDILARQVAFHLTDFVRWCYDHPMITFVIAPPVVVVETPAGITRNLEGIKVIVTGFRGDAEFKNNVAIRGGIYHDGAPTKKDAAISIMVATQGAGHNKIEAAQKFGITVMAREEFIERYFQ